MLHQITRYMHMPDQYIALSFLFILYAIILIIKDIYAGYLSGVTARLFKNFLKYQRYFILGVVLILASMLFFDLPIIKLCQRLHQDDAYTLIDFFGILGESWMVVGILITLSLVLDLFNKPKDVIICKIAYMSAIYAGLFNAIFKVFFNRQRPSIGLEPWHIFYFFRTHDTNWIDLSYAYNSMPSGHTITIVAAVIPLILYVSRLWQKLLLLLLPLLVIISRVYTINHWPSDVLLSTLFGVFIGLSAYQANISRIKK